MGRYSLWLIPCGEQERRLAETIERLIRERGGPRFEPHLTLLGGLAGAEEALVAATERLAALLHPITLRFQDIEFGDPPYRCLYLRVAGDGDLMAARGETVQQFGRTDAPPFMPHVSLFYGTVAAGSRAATAAALAGWRSVACRTDRIRLVATGGGPARWRSVRELALHAAPTGECGGNDRNAPIQRLLR